MKNYDFRKIPRQDFVSKLKATKRMLSGRKSPDSFHINQSFVLRHSDFHGRNILVQGTDIVGVIDWGKGGAYPLSQAFTGISVLQTDDNKHDAENFKWEGKIRRIVESEVRELSSRNAERLFHSNAQDLMVWELTREMNPIDSFKHDAFSAKHYFPVPEPDVSCLPELLG